MSDTCPPKIKSFASYHHEIQKEINKLELKMRFPEMEFYELKCVLDETGKYKEKDS